MTDFDLTIRHGTIINADETRRADIGIAGGIVVAIEERLAAGVRDVNAQNLLVIPGGVDSHVHVDQHFSSGAKIADDFATGSASALAGGTTTMLSFVMQPRGGSLREAAAAYHVLARNSRIDYSFHLTITDPTREVLEQQLPDLARAGHRSIKIFMTNASTRLDDAQILATLAAARQNGMIVCVHAEHHELIDWLTERLLKRRLTAPKSLAFAKPMIAEREATCRVIALAEALNTPIQIFHLSGEDSAEEVARAQRRGVQVWAETCSHYLVLSENDLDRPGFEGAKFMFAPPARRADQQQRLWDYIRDGTISIISSDHSPLNFDGTSGKGFAGRDAPFHKIPNGVPGLAARLPVVYSEGVAKGRIDAQTFVKLVSTMPAKLFGLFPRKGTVAVGSDADLVLWDPDQKQTLTNTRMHHGSDYTPYEGMDTVGAPTAVFLRGVEAFGQNRILAAPGTGAFLPRDAYPLIAPSGIFPAGFNPYD